MPSAASSIRARSIPRSTRATRSRQAPAPFGKLGSNLTATGTLDRRLGYALSYGVSTVDGPFNNDYLYQPGAAYDPSATDPAVHDLGVYQDDSTATTRSRGSTCDTRCTRVGDNNTKRLDGYNYSDLRLTATSVGPGSFSVAVTNLFQQDAFIGGSLNMGEPLALNQYATRADYAPYVRAGETEFFGLPYRSIYFTYSVQVK